MKLFLLLSLALVMSLWSVSPAAFADSQTAPASNSAASNAGAAAPAVTSVSSGRYTKLSFDNAAVVEGMNTGGLDSAENIGANDGLGQHLYRVRKDFNDQTPGLIGEMGYSE